MLLLSMIFISLFHYYKLIAFIEIGVPIEQVNYEEGEREQDPRSSIYFRNRIEAWQCLPSSPLFRSMLSILAGTQ